VLRVRWWVQPVIISVLLYVIVSDGSAWRAATLVGTASVAVVMTLLESRRVRHLGITRFEPAKRDVIALLVALPAAATMTGGFHSPMLVWFVPMMMLVAIMQTRRTALALLVGALAVTATFALIEPHARWMTPSPFVDAGGRLNGRFVLVAALLQVTFAIAVAAIGFRIREMSDAMLLRSLEARDETLKLHAERLNDLTTLTGEIAHELKNPLATIKGLAQLMEIEPTRARERLAVLRGEADRMQAILDEFLNFSRPLVPLARSRVDLGELARGVAELHEGVVGARGLTLVSPGDGPVELPCDARKVKQILINLVQNAIEASANGGEVHIAVDRRGKLASVRVLDRGHGLPPEIGERAFAAGMTSKERGSGLGLTVSRMMAEQHGGSLTLANRDGGGCMAELLLPIGDDDAAASDAGAPPAARPAS